MSRELIAAVDKHLQMEELLDWAKALVQVPSLNPPGDTRDVIRALRGVLGELGFSAFREYEPEPGMVSLVAEPDALVAQHLAADCGHAVSTMSR